MAKANLLELFQSRILSKTFIPVKRAMLLMKRKIRLTVLSVAAKQSVKPVSTAAT